MPLKALFSSLPSSDKRHRRHSSIIESIPQTSDGTPPRARNRGDSLKRLSLGLSRTNEDTFPPFFTHEPEEMYFPRPSVSHEPNPVSSTPPILARKSREDAPVEPSQSLVVDDLPLPNPKRFSLLGLRHASDPQLSTRFRQDSSKPDKAIARECQALIACSCLSFL